MGHPQNLKLASLIGLRAWQSLADLSIFSALNEHGLDYLLKYFLSFWWNIEIGGWLKKKKKENKKMESLHPESIFIIEERDRKDLKRSPT